MVEAPAFPARQGEIMGIWDGIKSQLRSVIEWDHPGQDELFYRWSENGDEIKNASRLIVGPGQGCIFVYEGRIRSVLKREGMTDLKTANIPFWTTVTKVLQAFESEHKVGIFFFSQAAILNQKWGTASAIKYEDPKYGFPVALKSYGNFSLRLIDPEGFFRHVVAGKERYFISDLRDILVGRILQSISDALAGARLSYAEIDAKRDELSADILARLGPEFGKLGFEASDFRIEGTDFDAETKERINRIAGTIADTHAATAAGLSFTEMQRVEAMRDAAKNDCRQTRPTPADSADPESDARTSRS
jgi:membrane protease subunit (stomatin/prohibitin family)